MEMESSKVQEDTDQKTDPFVICSNNWLLFKNIYALFFVRVLDNLKDYTVKTLVNFVDHLGTVASKLTDLFDQQSSDISTMEMRASCVSQQLLTCRTLLVLSDDLNQDRIIAMRQKVSFCVSTQLIIFMLFQSIQRHIYLKEPMDKVTSAAIPLALAASSLYMIAGTELLRILLPFTQQHYCSELGLKLQVNCSLCFAYL
ncbi:hypothetical protein Bca101_031411 [Brassica carinata]